MDYKNLFKKLLMYEEVEKDLDELDGHQLNLVLKALRKIEDTNGNIGQPLGNKYNINLSGYKKVKLKKAGIRIIFKVTDDEIFISEIICVGKREDLEVYREAYNRILERINSI